MMANELKATGTIGSAISAIVSRGSDGYIYDDGATNSYTITHDATAAAIALTEIEDTGRFVGDLPAGALSDAAGEELAIEYIAVAPASALWSTTVFATGQLLVNAIGTAVQNPATTGLGTAIDQQPVPEAMTVVVVTKAGVGNIGERSLTTSVGEAQAIALDFRNLMPLNGRITLVEFTQLTSSTVGSLAIGTAGQAGSQAKVTLTPDTASTYTMECVVTFADGGGQAAATVTIVVV